MINREESKQQALLSLDGLSVGDAIGEQLLRSYPVFSWDAVIPAGPLPWTDDTHMALSIMEVLCQEGGINQDHLAQRFADRYAAEPGRGYSSATSKFLTRLGKGGDWRTLTRERFSTGSYGNGAAMRAAPIGGFFAGNPAKAAEQAALSAEVTHAHPEGIAGAAAVAAAASLAAEGWNEEPEALLEKTLLHLPEGEVSSRIAAAVEIGKDQLVAAIKRLGTGYRVTAQDTVPFCLWVSAHFGTDFENALRITMQGMGDSDTTCAIVGGIVSLRVGKVPEGLLKSREPLPDLELRAR